MHLSAPENDPSTLLHDAGLKATMPRIRIIRLLNLEKKPLRIKDIYRRLSKYDVDMVTIYRTIEVLCEKNIVHRVDFGEDAAYYEFNRGDDRHHITCVGCKKRENIDFCFFSKAYKTLLLKRIPNFGKVMKHTMECFGLCKKCFLQEK